MTTSEYMVFCGLDVGKEAHHACALDPTGDGCSMPPCPKTKLGSEICLPGWPDTVRC